MQNKTTQFLSICKEAYYKGSPIISDDEYDALVDIYGEPSVGYEQDKDAVSLPVRMYSLEKIYEGEKELPDRFTCTESIETPKLDGSAVCLMYMDGKLCSAQTRGNGKAGKLVTERFKYAMPNLEYLPKAKDAGITIVTGEFLFPKDIDNGRNLAAGYLNRNEDTELPVGIAFVAYDLSTQYKEFDLYTDKLKSLHSVGFRVPIELGLEDKYPTDGTVIRINSESRYKSLGFTSKFPKGAIAVKQRTEGVPTVIRDIVWQTGRTGKVTPVAILDEINIEGAKVTKATLNNPDYMSAIGLKYLPAKVWVERAGGIIPKIVRVDHEKIDT